jgi:hypothetical protein
MSDAGLTHRGFYEPLGSEDDRVAEAMRERLAGASKGSGLL